MDDATVRWPDTRQRIALGEVGLTKIPANNASEQQHIIFDPVPRVDGIEASVIHCSSRVRTFSSWRGDGAEKL